MERIRAQFRNDLKVRSHNGSVSRLYGCLVTKLKMFGTNLKMNSKERL